MILETAQLLSTAVYLSDTALYAYLKLYRPTHQNHPCSKWTRASSSNFQWLVSYGINLSHEYQNRFNRKHKSSLIIEQLVNQSVSLPDVDRTPFVNCARNSSLNLDFTNIPCVYTAYKLYLNSRWLSDTRPPFCSV